MKDTDRAREAWETSVVQANTPELGFPEEDKTLDVYDEVWATDEWVARSLYTIANSAKKSHIDKYWNEFETIDYTTRVTALKEINREKAERRKNMKKTKAMPFNYILIN